LILEKKMFYGAKAETFRKAENLRKNMTEAELALWARLKGNQLKGYRFKPQHPIDIYIVDFYCHKLKLVIELDGEIHNYQKDYDEARTEELESFGLKVIRFTNTEVLSDFESVISKITETLL
jgi:very-short-patch-repair endonuclease